MRQTTTSVYHFMLLLGLSFTLVLVAHCDDSSPISAEDDVNSASISDPKATTSSVEMVAENVADSKGSSMDTSNNEPTPTAASEMAAPQTGGTTTTSMPMISTTSTMHSAPTNDNNVHPTESMHQKNDTDNKNGGVSTSIAFSTHLLISLSLFFIAVLYPENFVPYFEY